MEKRVYVYWDSENIFKESNKIEDYVMTIENTFLTQYSKEALILCTEDI